MNYQVYLNRNVLGDDEHKIKEAVIERLMEVPAIVNCF